jgi:hypothetical protein
MCVGTCCQKNSVLAQIAVAPWYLELHGVRLTNRSGGSIYYSSWHTATWLLLAWKTTKKRVIAFVWPADPVVLLARYHCLVMMMSNKSWNVHSFIPVFTT